MLAYVYNFSINFGGQYEYWLAYLVLALQKKDLGFSHNQTIKASLVFFLIFQANTVIKIMTSLLKYIRFSFLFAPFKKKVNMTINTLKIPFGQ